ncbi:hypothetical protein CTEN210_07437 [Chaetoceros tenuissimus]|uniref:RanBD1 domain-containing protein n=1 Tax=Chaetoceros tenuissimus TaxID=426638 RepID=A0AAD3CTN5_9STRA|nr:hypothetical protein CTEN210_07437 [Chaetoceros tenuissimus]
MGKRGNEFGHLSKEEYEAREARGEDDEQSNQSRKASADVLQRRRIVRVSNKWKKQNTMRAPSAGAPAATPNAFAATPLVPKSVNSAAPSAGSNAFSSVNFASKPATAMPPPTAVNPFAQVSFAKTPVPKKSSFAKTPAPTKFSMPQTQVSFATTPAPKQSSFAKTPAPTKTQTQSTPTSTKKEESPLKPLRPGAVDNEVIPIDAKAKRALALCVLTEIESKVNAMSNLSEMMLRFHSKSGDQWKDEPVEETSPAPAPAAAESSTPKFSFGGSTPAPAAAEESSTPKFSFGGSAAPAPAATFTGFSFGNKAAAVPPAPAPAPVDNEEPENADDDGGAPGLVAGEVDEDEELLFTCRAKYLRLVPKEGGDEKEWKSFSSGPLKLFRNKETGKCKILMRDEAVGQVRLNASVQKGTKIMKGEVSKKGVGTVTFATVLEADVGPENLMLKTKKEFHDRLFSTLEEMAK